MGSALAAKTIVARVPAAIGSVLLIPATLGRRPGRPHRPRCPFRELAAWADRPIAAAQDRGPRRSATRRRPTTYAGVVIAVDAAELLDLSDPDVVADPYPAFAALRAEAPVAWHSGLGIWVATSHAACSQVLRERALGRIFRPREPDHEWETFNWLHADSILDSEPPKHTRLRRLVQSAFSRGHVVTARPPDRGADRRTARRLRRPSRADGSFDVIADLAEPLPVLVIAELLGWPEADRHLLRPWSQAIVKMYELRPDARAGGGSRRRERRVRRIRGKPCRRTRSRQPATTCSPTWSRSRRQRPAVDP